MNTGNFVLILHTHLPWVLNHGQWPHGEDWLFEAAAECYIPLLNVFNDLLKENILPKVTLDISPVLCEQLEHPDFTNKFKRYCEDKIVLARKDERQFKEWGYDPHHIYLTQFWQNWYQERIFDFIEKYDSSIIKSLKKLQDIGAIEIMTCGATHGYLPLLGTEKSINLQIKTAVENYYKYFNRLPRGIWLPECAYRPSYVWKSFIPVYPFNEPRLRPGIEQILANFGIQYFITDQNLLERSVPIGVFLDAEKTKFVTVDSPSYKHFPYSFDKSPLNIYNVASSEKIEYGYTSVFTRHRDICMQVWSGEIGYPGEPDYLDFHKKHFGSMLRYWRVTDNKADMMYKQLYHPDWIYKKIDLQANHFIHHVENTLNYYFNQTNKKGTLCVPFDTELFGHWWFEGPLFIKYVLKGLSFSPYVKAATTSEQIYMHNPSETVLLPEGSWGVNNNHDVWSNPDNYWTWENIYNNENRFNEILRKIPDYKNNPIIQRILIQALKEMLLLQSSDWQFLIYTKSAKDYAEQRFFFHHSDFNRLCDLAEKVINTGEINSFEISLLESTEKRNNCFPELQIDWWSD